MADFPTSPATNATFTDDSGVSWTFDGFGWGRTSSGAGVSLPADAAGHLTNDGAGNLSWESAGFSTTVAVGQSFVLTRQAGTAGNLGDAVFTTPAGTYMWLNDSGQALVAANKSLILGVDVSGDFYADGGTAEIFTVTTTGVMSLDLDNTAPRDSNLGHQMVRLS